MNGQNRWQGENSGNETEKVVNGVKNWKIIQAQVADILIFDSTIRGPGRQEKLELTYV